MNSRWNFSFFRGWKKRDRKKVGENNELGGNGGEREEREERGQPARERFRNSCLTNRNSIPSWREKQVKEKGERVEDADGDGEE